jgi:hypothetical protein
VGKVGLLATDYQPIDSPCRLLQCQPCHRCPPLSLPPSSIGTGARPWKKNPHHVASSPPSPWIASYGEPHRRLACLAHGPWTPPAFPVRRFPNHQSTSPHWPRHPTGAGRGDLTVLMCACPSAGMGWLGQLGCGGMAVGLFGPPLFTSFSFSKFVF